MKHDEFKILVSTYHDGEVTAEERALVEAHLAGCAECAESLAAYGRMGGTLHRLPRGEPSRTLWQRVQEGRSSRRRWALAWRLLPVAPVLAMLAIAVTLIVVLGTQPGMLGPAQPVAQREGVADQDTSPTTLAAPLESPLPAMAPESVATERQSEYGLTMAPPCPGGMADLEVVNQSVRSDEGRAAPRLEGVLYDAADQPLAGAILLVSDLVSWTSATTTTADGTFAMDLPARGTYYIALAGNAVAAKSGEECDIAGAADAAISGTAYLSQTNAFSPGLALEINDRVSVTLRVR